jgi:hypothetical protein
MPAWRNLANFHTKAESSGARILHIAMQRVQKLDGEFGVIEKQRVRRGGYSAFAVGGERCRTSQLPHRFGQPISS